MPVPRGTPERFGKRSTSERRSEPGLATDEDSVAKTSAGVAAAAARAAESTSVGSSAGGASEQARVESVGSVARRAANGPAADAGGADTGSASARASVLIGAEDAASSPSIVSAVWTVAETVCDEVAVVMCAQIGRAHV